MKPNTAVRHLCPTLLSLSMITACAGISRDQQIADWKKDVNARLEARKYYPYDPENPSSVPSGTVVIGLVLDKSGRILKTQTVHSSGNPLLDWAGITTVVSAGPFPPPPLEEDDKAVFLIPLNYFPEGTDIAAVNAQTAVIVKDIEQRANSPSKNCVGPRVSPCSPNETAK